MELLSEHYYLYHLHATNYGPRKRSTYGYLHYQFMEMGYIRKDLVPKEAVQRSLEIYPLQELDSKCYPLIPEINCHYLWPFDTPKLRQQRK